VPGARAAPVGSSAVHLGSSDVLLHATTGHLDADVEPAAKAGGR
jgi:hypothetical protein